jgi:MFS family permease
VNISVAIIPMAQDFGWSPTVSGLVQSSFFYGYALTQIPGGYVTSRVGGRTVLPAGVGLWSAATAAVPLLAGTIPGAHKRPHWQLSIPSPARQRCFGCWGLAEALDWSEQLHSWDTPESLL